MSERSVKPRKVEKGDRVKLTGTLSACSPESVIEFQILKGGQFTTFAESTTGDDCMAVAKRRVKKKTTFRAHAPSEEGFLEATSPQVKVKVRLAAP